MPKIAPPANFSVTDHGDARLGHNRLSVDCEHDGYRFHYWADINLNPQRNEDGTVTIFKNPPFDIGYRDEGWFKTRYLTNGKGQGKIVFDAMAAAAPGLLPAALKARADYEAARKAKQQDAEREYRAEKAGPQLVLEARKLLEVVKRESPEPDTTPLDSPSGAWESGWDAAMAAVSGEMAGIRALLRQVDGETA